MEPTVCPWCQSEIVWDEEIGPEDTCPHCANELKGYRTLNIALEGEDAEADQEELDEDYEATEEEAVDLQRIWGSENESLSSLRTVDKYGEDHDLFAFEETVEAILDEQDEVPECLHCREYMLHAGTQHVSGEGFQPVNAALIRGPILQPPYELNVYVCPGCFHVQYNLAENDRLRMIKSFIHKKE
ncbi:hypothetical protein [Paenibacillus sp. Cedars]|uniref:hypothetical protein n=1 Tax=Paenibacillus sp. Cedars TaxID=1980674 RepID=UPI00116478FB|nr:hypothetical protein [Paenibacillus sp. Cedars]AWP26150.1 hypothetical protein B9D94_05815 [Paenibacillus sp. Cedars]